LISETEFFTLTEICESNSEHPIGKSIYNYSKIRNNNLNNNNNNEIDDNNDTDLLISKEINYENNNNNNLIKNKCKNFQNIAGEGIKCEINNKLYLIGSIEFLENNNIKINNEEYEKIFNEIKKIRSIVCVGYDGNYIGFFSMFDSLRYFVFLYN
jgi:cation transport ATPase